MVCNALMLIKRIWASNILKNEQMGYKLLKIMANGLYDVFHRFGGWLLGLLGWRRRCPKFFLTRTQCFVNLINTQQWLLDVHPTASVLLQSLIFLLQPPKPAPTGLPAPSSRGWLCCRQAIPLTTCTSCYFPVTSASPRSRPVSAHSPLSVGIRCSGFADSGCLSSWAPPSSTAFVLSARRGQHGQQTTAIGRGWQ